jgi:hypothetical protein
MRCVGFVHNAIPGPNGEQATGIEVGNGNVTIVGSSFAALVTGAINTQVTVRGGVLCVDRGEGGKSYALNCSFAGYTDCTSQNSTVYGLATQANKAFQVHANVAFAAQGAAGVVKPLDDSNFSTDDFAPGGAVAHLITPVDGTAGLDPFEGLIIYDTSDDKLKYWDGAWKTIAVVP